MRGEIDNIIVALISAQSWRETHCTSLSVARSWPHPQAPPLRSTDRWAYSEQQVKVLHLYSYRETSTQSILHHAGEKEFSTYRGLWGLVVVRLSWLSGRALAAQARGVPSSTPGSCQPFYFRRLSPGNNCRMHKHWMCVVWSSKGQNIAFFVMKILTIGSNLITFQWNYIPQQ